MTHEKNDPDSLMPRDVVKQLEDLRARLLAGGKDLQAEMKRYFEEKNQRGDQRLASQAEKVGA
jgi:hypothetical protein